VPNASDDEADDSDDPLDAFAFEQNLLASVGITEDSVELALEDAIEYVYASIAGDYWWIC
jgi:hypothetical protein